VLPRFYAPDLDADIGRVALPIDEARHLTRVLRLGAGDEVNVFDGRGAEFRAVVEVAVRDTVAVQLLEPVPAPLSFPTEIFVVQAVLKGSSMDDAIRDATMMGAAAIHPVLTAHTDVKTMVATRAATLDRWRRIALAAVKQSRRATLPTIEPARAFGDWLSSPAGELRLLFAEPSAACPTRAVRSLLAKPLPASAAILLGPEGGWSPDEVGAALAGGCIGVTLGPLTVRAESMPVAALAALAAIWQPEATEETQGNRPPKKHRGTQRNSPQKKHRGTQEKKADR
jgi:16S rRNA (uracil1498-N3)-methyltransferase